MRYGLTAAAAAMAAVSAVAAVLSGCAGPDQSPSRPSTPYAQPIRTSAAAADPGPLPTPELLTDVMYRLADPAVPGADKLPLLQNGAAPDAQPLDRFSAALRDGGFSPVSFQAADVRWADSRPGDAVALITVSTTNPAKPGDFSLPMLFHAGPGGWQLSRETAEMLLAFGDARAPR